MSEIKYYTCGDCRSFRWCKETGEGNCHNIGCEVSSDTDACDRFEIDDYISAMEI